LAELLVNEGGITDHVVLCAAILHDTIEDTETPYASCPRSSTPHMLRRGQSW
jgi:guanosine-3',5'-bis(diphosphate) 3'-pyrophosphohydrolase